MVTVDVEAFRRDGYVEFGSLLKPTDCDQIRRLFDDLDRAGDVAPSYEPQYDSDGARRRLRKVRRLLWNEPSLFGPILNAAGAPDIAEELIGRDAVAILHAAFLKPAHIGSAVALHQDQALWGREYPGAFSVWFALTEVDPDNGGLYGVPGSHRAGTIAHADDPGHPWHDSLAHIADELGTPHQFVLAPGEVVMWDRNFAHGSAANTSDRDRRGMVLVFADSSAPGFAATDMMRLDDLRALARS